MFSCSDEDQSGAQVFSRVSLPVSMEEVNEDQIECDTIEGFDLSSPISISASWSEARAFNDPGSTVEYDIQTEFKIPRTARSITPTDKTVHEILTMDSTLAGVPQRTFVGYFGANDQNNLGITYMSRLQGLRHQQIN
ncbi:MAG: hypothetical protein ACKO6L_02030, partial [Flavobacteriales bacterium]